VGGRYTKDIMNTATKMICENALGQWGSMGYDKEETVSAATIRDYYLRQLDDFSDCYDEEWYALIGTKAIEKTIDWQSIAEAVNQQIASLFD